MSPEDARDFQSGPIAWMARNNVAANLLMAFFLIAGVLMSWNLRQQIFPGLYNDTIQISVIYPGATPVDVEQGILLAIEGEVNGMEGVESLSSHALEGRGIVFLKLQPHIPSERVLQDAKNRVDSILSFPQEAEKPIISLINTDFPVISLIISGKVDFALLREVADDCRRELLRNPQISQISTTGIRPLEIAVEIPQSQLRGYHLSLDGVAGLLRRSALNIPAGEINTPGGQFLIRTEERRDQPFEFQDIPVVANTDGSTIFLRDIATITEELAEEGEDARYNGIPAIRLDVLRTGDQQPIAIADGVKKWLEEKRLQLPNTVQLNIWWDSAEIYRSRIQLMVNNGVMGLVLVVIILALFLEPYLAFWTAMGMITTFTGAFIILPLVGPFSINMVSSFAFIITLGIVVDDAIVVGEMVHQHRERGFSHLESSILGTKRIATPVFFAVLTNIVAFLPLFFVPGPMGKIFFQIPVVTTTVFAISLIEALYILPGHLSHVPSRGFWFRGVAPVRKWISQTLRWSFANLYRPCVLFVMEHHYKTLLSSLALFLFSLALPYLGYVPVNFNPDVESEIITARAILPFGSAKERALSVEKELIAAAHRVVDRFGGPHLLEGVYSQVGTPIQTADLSFDKSLEQGSHIVGAQVWLTPEGLQKIGGDHFSHLWRHETEELPGVANMEFETSFGKLGGVPIVIRLTHPDMKPLADAAKITAKALEGYSGVVDIDDGVPVGKPVYELQILPEALGLGLTAEDLGGQVRAAFYGAEAFRQQKGRHEVKVLVRLPLDERQSVFNLQNLVIHTPKGGEILLSEAASIQAVTSFSSINRFGNERTIDVSASLEPGIDRNLIVEDLEANFLPSLSSTYPGIAYSLQGSTKEQRDIYRSMAIGFMFVLMALYGLMAIPLKDYLQPIIVLLSIPLGYIGALAGHLFLGYSFSVYSLFGIVGLSGLIINDALVLIGAANAEEIDHGLPPKEALLAAAASRFRPIILTSLTTFLGLAPMIFETATQAKFLIPLAISLGFGALFGSVIQLLVIPAAYLALEELRHRGN